MTFSSNSFFSFIIYRSGFKTHQRNHSTQEKIDFFKFRKLLQHPRRNESIISMIINHFRPHCIHKFIKTLSRIPFKKRIGCPLRTNAIHNIAPFEICIDHLIHRIYIVLSITIDRYCYITKILSFHQSCQNSILVSAITTL